MLCDGRPQRIGAFHWREHQFDRHVSRKHVDPAPRHRVMNGVLLREITNEVRTSDARCGAQCSCKLRQNGIRIRTAPDERPAVHVDGCAIERNRSGVHFGIPQLAAHLSDGGLHVVSNRCGATSTTSHEFRKGRRPVVCRQRKHDRARVTQLVQRIDERTQGAIETEDVVVLLAGVRAVSVSDVVRRRE